MINTVGDSLIDTLSKIDKIINESRDFVKSVETSICILNMGMVCIATVVLMVQCFPTLQFIDMSTFYVVLLILIGLSNVLLIFTVLRIRVIVRNIGHGLPNETFLNVHFIIFVVAGFLQLVANIFRGILQSKIETFKSTNDDYEESADYYHLQIAHHAYSITSGLTDMVVVIFLLWLILSYMKDNNSKSKDAVLNRDVPNIVYILNKKMLKGIVNEELANDELKK